VTRIVGIARRPFDPAAYGWTKLEYRRGDVRDEAALRDAFAGADVVVHLAFLVTGGASAEVLRAVNVDGTVNAFRAAEAGRSAPLRLRLLGGGLRVPPRQPDRHDRGVAGPARRRLFYAQEKAELEYLLQAEAARTREDGATSPALYLLRPPMVLGPHAVGAKDLLPARWPRSAASWQPDRPVPVPLPVLVPLMPLQYRARGRPRPGVCCAACWPPARPVPTTSPRTGSSAPPTWPASSA